MPIYEFKCPICETKTEKLCQIGEKGEKFVCTQCDYLGLLRMFSGFSSPGVAGGKSGCAPDCHGNCASCH